MVLLTPIGYSLTGEPFNLNMEEIATDTAITLNAEKLIFIVAGKGALSADGKHLQQLTAEQAEQLLQTAPQARDTAAYLPCAIRAARSGVPRVHLVTASEDGALLCELFTHEGSGTMITRDPLVKVRPAHIDDVSSILNLIRPLEERGILVKRSVEHLERDIDQYSLLDHDDKICGCVAMHQYPESSMAELACLVVSSETRDAGYGERLLQHVEEQARDHHISHLFVLTTQTAHWFVERGFVAGDLSQLPPQKQDLYNHVRRSKVFIKQL